MVSKRNETDGYILKGRRWMEKWIELRKGWMEERDGWADSIIYIYIYGHV